MRRPASTREALGFTPPLKANRANPSRIEGVPLMTASARPEVFRARRPAAERAPDRWAGRIAALLLLDLAIHDYG